VHVHRKKPHTPFAAGQTFSHQHLRLFSDLPPATYPEDVSKSSPEMIYNCVIASFPPVFIEGEKKKKKKGKNRKPPPTAAVLIFLDINVWFGSKNKLILTETRWSNWYLKRVFLILFYDSEFSDFMSALTQLLWNSGSSNTRSLNSEVRWSDLYKMNLSNECVGITYRTCVGRASHRLPVAEKTFSKRNSE